MDHGDEYSFASSYGIYYDRSALAPGEGLYFSPPYYDFHLYAALPQFPLTLSDPFPQITISRYPDRRSRFSVICVRPISNSGTSTCSEGLGGGRVLELAYAGTKGTKLDRSARYQSAAAEPGADQSTSKSGVR